MATHPTLDDLADGATIKGVLDGDLSVRRKDEQTSGYLDDIEAVRAEMRRSAVEGRTPDLRPFTTTAIGAAGVHLREPKTEKDVPVSVDLSEQTSTTGPAAPATLPAQRVEIAGVKAPSPAEENNAAESSLEVQMNELDPKTGEPTKKAEAARKKASQEFADKTDPHGEGTDKAPPHGASNESPQANPKKAAKKTASAAKKTASSKK